VILAIVAFSPRLHLSSERFGRMTLSLLLAYEKNSICLESFDGYDLAFSQRERHLQRVGLCRPDDLTAMDV
jgi:hypothetical protein